MAEPGLLEWEPGSRVRLGSVLLTTARHTLGLSILDAGQWDSTVGRRAHTGSLAFTLPLPSSHKHGLPESSVCDVTRSVQEARGWWGGSSDGDGSRRRGGGVGGCFRAQQLKELSVKQRREVYALKHSGWWIITYWGQCQGRLPLLNKSKRAQAAGELLWDFIAPHKHGEASEYASLHPLILS